MNETTHIPLSARMRPLALSDFVGQSHLTDEGKPIHSMLENSILHSMIFYGLPATGKTSLAEILARTLEYHFVRTNALTLDTDRIKKLLKDAEQIDLQQRKTVIFIDEIHRLIKPKQDAFLSAMENGSIILIGATTENPWFILQPALRSRLFIFEFKPHTTKELTEILNKALQNDKNLIQTGLTLSPEARQTLIDLASDPRMMLNILEMCYFNKKISENTVIDKEDVLTLLQKPDTLYSGKEAHYDVISAFIKSVRGSDVDAALYWLALMLESGEDPLFIARRLIILSSEDVGLALPEALPTAMACYQAIEKIGMPEGRFPLAETTILLTGAPKSNSSIALFKAIEEVKNGKILKVPNHLRDSHFSGAKNLNRGVDYCYPHNFPKHYIDQPYTPEPVHYYNPGNLGFEKKIRNWLSHLKQSKENK